MMNFFLRLFQLNSRKIFSRFVGNNNRICKEPVTKFIQRYHLYLQHKRPNDNYKLDFTVITYPILLGFSLFRKNDETKEEKLINTIKRSILCVNKLEYDKAEQMLHVALRMAQDMQNHNGITYIFDVMANLAMERKQYDKSEKLFVDILKRLIQDGLPETDAKVLHISSKLAYISFLRGATEKSLSGFLWTINKIENNLKDTPEDKDLLELLGLTQNWYGQLLLSQEKYEDAKKCFAIAYDIYTSQYGKHNPEAITLLNNLSVVTSNLGDIVEAQKYLEEALELAQYIPDWTESGILKANLGLLYLRDGLIEKARETCSHAWKLGRKNSNKKSVEQAEYCLDRIKAFIAKSQK